MKCATHFKAEYCDTNLNKLDSVCMGYVVFIYESSYAMFCKIPGQRYLFEAKYEDFVHLSSSHFSWWVSRPKK